MNDLSQAKREALQALSESLSNPGAAALYRAARKQRLELTQKQVSEFVSRKAEKQVFGKQKTQGKIASESLDARWQCDIMMWYQGDKKEPKRLVYYVVCVNIFDRFIYVSRTFKKEPGDILLALETILMAAPKQPKLITSDQEFSANQIQEYLRGQQIEQLFKEVGDPNSLGVVDRAIQLIKARLAEQQEAGDTSPWSSRIDSVVAALNKTPKPEVLHGAAPEEIRDENPEARFMLQQDNAEKLQHNEKLTQKRVAALEKSGGRFRAPLITRSSFKRGFTPSFGSMVLQSEGVVAGRVSARGKSYNIKSIRPIK